MTTIDQIKTLMRSGDIAGADMVPETAADAPWARPYQSVESHKSKVAGRKSVDAGLLRLPRAACGAGGPRIHHISSANGERNLA